MQRHGSKDYIVYHIAFMEILMLQTSATVLTSNVGYLLILLPPKQTQQKTFDKHNTIFTHEISTLCMCASQEFFFKTYHGFSALIRFSVRKNIRPVKRVIRCRHGSKEQMIQMM